LSFCCQDSILAEHRVVIGDKKRRILQKVISYSGYGLFTGKRRTVCLRPAEKGAGVVFKRTDLLHSPEIPARLEYVQSTPRCTILGSGGAVVQTVEHLLAALYALGITDIVIEVDGPEIPIMDGSAAPFMTLLEESAELSDIEETYAKISLPVAWSQGDVHLVALPSKEYRISYTLHYPQSSLLRAQFYSFMVEADGFKTHIAPARTFSLYEEIIPLIERGVIQGGSLHNAVLIKEDQVMNPEGLRFPDEMVRHKILDMIGDLSLIGYRLAAHVIAIRSGHTSNVAFAKQLYQHIKLEEI